MKTFLAGNLANPRHRIAFGTQAAVEGFLNGLDGWVQMNPTDPDFVPITGLAPGETPDTIKGHKA